MVTHRVIYDVKEVGTNQIIEIIRTFRNADEANAFFQEVKAVAISKPIIEIITKE